MAVIREATGTAGESLSLLAERERAGDEPTISADSDGAI